MQKDKKKEGKGEAINWIKTGKRKKAYYVAERRKYKNERKTRIYNHIGKRKYQIASNKAIWASEGSNIQFKEFWYIVA